MGLDGVWKDKDGGVLVRLCETKMLNNQNKVYGSMEGKLYIKWGNWPGDLIGIGVRGSTNLTSVLPKRDIVIMLTSGDKRNDGHWEIHGIVFHQGAFVRSQKKEVDGKS